MKKQLTSSSMSIKPKSPALSSALCKLSVNLLTCHFLYLDLPISQAFTFWTLTFHIFTSSNYDIISTNLSSVPVVPLRFVNSPKSSNLLVFVLWEETHGGHETLEAPVAWVVWVGFKPRTVSVATECICLTSNLFYILRQNKSLRAPKLFLEVWWSLGKYPHRCGVLIFHLCFTPFHFFIHFILNLFLLIKKSPMGLVYQIFWHSSDQL